MRGAVLASSTIQNVRVGDCSVHMMRAGKGRPLLFLHGAGGVPLWLPFMASLSERYDVIVPDHPDKIGIRVANRICHWQEGRALIFDDAYEHEAWNESDQARVVLFVDFVKPLRFPANLVNATLLSLAAFTPFIREGNDNLQRWEKEFHRAK